MTGFLGKLPTVGDFIARGLDRSVSDAWFKLCDAALAVGSGTHQDWYATCQGRPALCFSLAPGALTGDDDPGWVGVLRPSLDSFGRSYPVAVLAPLPAGLTPLAAPRVLARWYERADLAVLSALEGALTVDRLVEVLATIAPAPGQTGSPAGNRPVPLHFGRESVHGWGGFSPGPTDVGRLEWTEMLLTELLSGQSAPTLWWHPGMTGDAEGGGVLLRALPKADVFRALLDDSWMRAEA